jgi:hypothetical protein
MATSAAASGRSATARQWPPEHRKGADSRYLDENTGLIDGTTEPPAIAVHNIATSGPWLASANCIGSPRSPPTKQPARARVGGREGGGQAGPNRPGPPPSTWHSPVMRYEMGSGTALASSGARAPDWRSGPAPFFENLRKFLRLCTDVFLGKRAWAFPSRVALGFRLRFFFPVAGPSIKRLWESR